MGAGVVEQRLHQRGSDAAAAERRVHLGVRDGHHAIGEPVVGNAGVAFDDGLKAAELGQVFDREVHRSGGGWHSAHCGAG